MHLCNSASFSRAVVVGIQPIPEEPSCATEQEFFVDIHELVGPKLVLVKDICCEKLRRDPAGKILDGFASSRSVDAGAVKAASLTQQIHLE